jgi:hypothetical protein
MKGERKIISGSKTKMHVWMSDLLGTSKAAANARELNEPSKKALGEKKPEHTASRKEREYINEENRRSDGDLNQDLN